ncbi:uncharacterized protein [Battus philenor]|uniref:uncharacterized protein n=1 Tax=Battus philenor TaxID=42288 RepID=UPI0035CFE804
MATMVKEKRREKKKTKEKRIKVSESEELESESNVKINEEPKIIRNTDGIHQEVITEATLLIDNITSDTVPVEEVTQDEDLQNFNSTVENLSSRYNESPGEALYSDQTCENTDEHGIPSAPLFDEETNAIPAAYNIEAEAPVAEVMPKIQCMTLQEAIRLFGGMEINEVRTISEKEESIVEAGPVSGPEHPLVDLLTTFRSSLNAVERAKNTISQGFVLEEKSRAALWKIERRQVFMSQECPPCARTVHLNLSYVHAELQKEKIPAARMRLESLAREVQESFCHHQHSALLAYCQIEELVYETIRSNKGEIREALSLVLQALRLADDNSQAYSSSLRQWAVVLTASLLDNRDLRHLIFLIHHLFRQTRSVQWASQVIRVQVTDLSSAARVIGLLELLLAKPGLETAVECTEDLDEAWEEVGKRGEGSAVSDGRLRERDALALLKALPLRQLLAKLALFSRSDIRGTQEHEWGDSSGGHGVLKAACGVRALLSVLQRAMCVHAQYTRLHRALQTLCVCALHLLAALHLRSRAFYHEDLHAKVLAELEASFVAGIAMFNVEEFHMLPTTLLSDGAARDYCVEIIQSLHDYSPRCIPSLGISLPESRCDARVRNLVQVALDRTDDDELTRTLLEFLCQTAVRRKQLSCGNPCGVAAQEGLPRVLAVHPQLHTTSLHILAELNQAEPVDQKTVSYLAVQEWRPTLGEVIGVLEDWSLKCPHLIEQLLLQMDYTPHHGVSLETQLTIGLWLCGYMNKFGGNVAEWAWLVMRKLCVHRTCWALPLDAPPPDPEPPDLFSTTFALLSTNWGHSVPLICSVGIKALCDLARQRPQEAAHCLGAMMRVMQHSPESVALTPKFTEVFSILLGTGPSLVARALGRGGPSGADLLERTLLNQLTGSQSQYVGALNPWLRGLWAPTLPSAARALLDMGLRAARDWPALDATVAIMLQGGNSKEFVTDAVRNAAHAPLLCEAALRGAHARCEVTTHTWPRLLDALAQQRAKGQRVHVDNALKQIGALINAEELVMYRVATAALSAPWQHPAHLTLWRLFFHLYLQRPPSSPQTATAPVGPLFYSGIIKSRVLSQLKKRLQDTIGYHHTRSEQLKSEVTTVQTQQVATTSKDTKTTPSTESNFFPSLTITDFTGERSLSDSQTESSDEESEEERENDCAVESAVSLQEKSHLYCYHIAAEKLVREYARWLNEGDRVRVASHHADIARFISEQGLDASWKSSLPDWFRAVPPSESRNLRPPQPTHLQRAIGHLLKIHDYSATRPRIPRIKALLEGHNLGDARSVYNLVDQFLREFETLGKDWSGDVKRLAKLDSALWQLVGALYVARPIQPYKKACSDNCPPLTFLVLKDEWVLSPRVQQEFEENRRSALAVLRRLARPRVKSARLAASLQILARHVRSNETARRVAERAGQSADNVADFAPAHNAISTLVTSLAERWLCSDVEGCGRLVLCWGVGGSGRKSLCSALVSPRSLDPAAFQQLYQTLLSAPLPAHEVFSYLSRFEMSPWADKVDSAKREKMLEILVRNAERLGQNLQPEYNVLLELIGVHIRAVCRVSEVCWLILHSSAACTRGTFPSGLCAHVALAAAQAHSLTYNELGVEFSCLEEGEEAARLATAAADLVIYTDGSLIKNKVDATFCLGNLLRSLGKLWWGPRTALTAETDSYVQYATFVADLLQTLQRAFAAATAALEYDAEKASWFSWSALSEAWAPWVYPGYQWSLLPITHSDGRTHACMLQRFVETLQIIIDNTPGSDEFILRYVWEWTVHIYLAVSIPGAAQGSRVQLSTLLATLEALGWTQTQWMHANCMPLALQVSRSTDKEITTWCCLTWRNTGAGSWLRGIPDEQLAPHLAALLSIFCSPHLQLPSLTLNEATRLPWYRLPEAALDAAFEQFFVDHHNPAFPYHETPQFRVLLAASQLIVVEGVEGVAAACPRRARSVSQCVRAASAPELISHVVAFTRAILRILSDLAPHIENSEGEIEELLSRAIVIMCIEPAAGAALPVWGQWIQECGSRLRLACASAVASLTALEYFVPLVEVVAKAHMTRSGSESGGWGALRGRWAACPWGAAAASAAAATRRSWHAAYALLPAPAQPPTDVIRTLSQHDLTASDDDPIMAVWVCVACRVARESQTSAVATPPANDKEERALSARAVLSRWAAEPRRSLLQVVAMQQNYEAAKIRLLARYAQCVLSPASETLTKAYEASCATLPASNQPEFMSWGKAPRAKYLPRLAEKLYAGKGEYFKDELEIVSNDT